MSSNHPYTPYQQLPQHQGQNNQSFQPQGPQPQSPQYGRPTEYSTASQRWTDFTPSQQSTYEPPPQPRQQHSQVPGVNMGVASSRSNNPQDTLMNGGSVSTSGPQPPARTATASPIPSHHYTYTAATHTQSYQQPPTSIADMAPTVVSSSGSGRGRATVGHEPTPVSGFVGYPQYPGHFGPQTSSMAAAPQYRTSGPQRVDEYFDYTHHSPTTSASSYGSMYQTADTPRPTPPAPTYPPAYPEGTALGYTQGYQTENSRRYQQTGAPAHQVSRAVLPAQTQHQISGTITPVQTQQQASGNVTPAQHQMSSTVMQIHSVEQYPVGVAAQQATTQHPQSDQHSQSRIFPPPSTPAANAPSEISHTSSYQIAPPQPQHATPRSATPRSKPNHHRKEGIVSKTWTGSPAVPQTATRVVSHEELQKILRTHNIAGLGTAGIAGTEPERLARNGAGPVGQSQTWIQAPQQASQPQPTGQQQQQQQQQPTVHLAHPRPLPHQHHKYSQLLPEPPVSQAAPQPQKLAQPQAQLSQHQPQPVPPPEPAHAPSETRPPPPLNKDLMEQQMKIMVERMRYYQASDPVTFQTVWDNVRKNGQAGSVGGEERKAIMPATAGMTRSESTASERAVVYTPSRTPAKVADVMLRHVQQAQHAQSDRSLVPAPTQPTAPPPVHIQPQSQHQPLPPPPSTPLIQLNPPQDALHLRTAQAVSKYMIKTSGHCLPEEVIVDLLHRIKSFPVLCDKLESMGYKFHRGSFSRFLLAEVDGKKDEPAIERVDMEVKDKDMVMADVKADNGASRVLGEVRDDQEQLINEANEARVERVIVRPTPSPPAPPAKMGKGRPKKSASEGLGPLETSQRHSTAIVAAPETPTLPNRQMTALPTPVSAAPTVSTAPLDGPVPVMRMAAPVFHQQSLDSVYHPPSDDQLSPSPGLDFPRHPTPQSVKVAHAAPLCDTEMEQFISPSLVYRPPTPPPVIEIDSSPSPPLSEVCSPTPPEEILPPPDGPKHGQRTSEQSRQEFPGSWKLTKIVKLRLKSLGQNMPAASPSPPPAPVDGKSQPVGRVGKTVIDLTASATPEPQMNRAPQLPASAPDPRNLIEKEQQWLDPGNPGSTPTPTIQQTTTIPQTAPVTRGIPTENIEPILFKHIDPKKPLRKPQYDLATIARDIHIATGRSPQWVRPLNAHLDLLRTRGSVTLDADLATVRWDLLDPGPVGFAIGYDAGIDDDDDGGYGGEFEGAGVTAARPPVMLNNRAAMKGMAGQVVAPSPTPAARGRTKIRKLGTLGTSVINFQNSEGLTTTSNGTGSTDGRTGSQAISTNGNGNSSRRSSSSANTNGGGASWGGFPAPTPRPGSIAGSGLRNFITPDTNGNFAVVIRSSSVSSTDRNRAPESTDTRNLKRKLDGSDKEKGTPVTKKAAKPARLSTKKTQEEAVTDMRPSGFKVFKCRWKLCPAELHNFETLHRHVIKAHCKLASYGGYPCHWVGCSRSPTKEMKNAAAANRGPGKVIASRITWDFDTPQQWETHVLGSHLEGVKHEIGVGPSVGPYGAFLSPPHSVVRGSTN